MKSFLTVLFITVFLSGCVTTTQKRAYNFENVDIKTITPHVSTKAEVRNTLGSPSLQANINQEHWYYIETTSEHLAFLDPTITKQRILRIAFADNDLVTDVQFVELDNRTPIEFNPEITKTEGHSLGIVEQLLGNVGRFNPAPKELGSNL